ncbi:outer membrane protein OmpA [Thiomonas sp.]|jgi:OOP family OmpA-OmpF porin|uniref:outer membrane protein OmpA n=1 Tax=Thiomonas sp. TaxID=2047785 RepID=UPI002632628D|nr:OmpA family protein [Thiomonas sp.]
MIKTQKFGKLLVVAALAACSSAAFAQGSPDVNNWVSPFGQTWRDGTGNLCWRDNFWTPATAATGCDGAIVAKAAAPAPVAEPAPAPAPAPAPVPVPTSEKITYSADAFFNFDKSVLLPAGKQALDELAQKIKEVNLETVISTGYTDSFGPVKYNLKLSQRRAMAVKEYLVSQGIPADKVYIEGKGKTDFRVDPKSCHGTFKARVACQAPNRRAVVEIVGTHTVMKQPDQQQ